MTSCVFYNVKRRMINDDDVFDMNSDGRRKEENKRIVERNRSNKR